MTGRINVYPSTLPGEPIERHIYSGKLGQWLRDNVNGYGERDSHPIAVDIAGAAIPPEDWDDLPVAGDVNVRILAQDPITAIYVAVAVLTVYTIYTLSNMPSLPGSRKQTAGKELESASAKANQVKLGDAIPEQAGRFKRFPDYLTAPHRYFTEPREQYIDLLLCLGAGKYDVAEGDIYIGETSLLSLGADATYTIYPPGASVAADPAAQNWYSCVEVGGSSLGTAGLELKATYEVETTSTATAHTFNAFDITVPAGAGVFPDGWASGMIARIEEMLDYTVTNGGAGVRDIISADFTQLGPFAGMIIEIAGENAGLYKIETFTPGTPDQITLSYDDGSPVTALLTGTRRMAIGYRGLLYRITAASTTAITVERLTDTGATDAAWLGYDSVTTSDALIQIDDSSAEGDWTGPFAACPAGEVTDKIEWDIFFPRGLTKVSEKGDLQFRKVTVEIQYRDIAVGGAWSSSIIDYNERTLDQIGFTESVTLGSAYRPEVRARRIGADSQSTSVQDTIHWYGLRTQLPAATSYPGVTAISLKIRGGERLAAQSENKINLISTRILPVRADGAWLPESPTRSIAAFVAHVAHSIGYTDDQIDLLELDRLDDIWAARGDYYDWVHDESTVVDVINSALRAGFAELTVDAGVIVPVRDEIRTTFEQLYTPQNMTEPMTRTVAAVRPDDEDGVDVEYVDGVTWAPAVVECRLPGDAGAKVTKLKADGVIDRDRAWRIGMRRRRAARYRRWSYDFQTELDALNSRYLSYVALGVDVPGYGKSSIVQSAVIDGSDCVLLLSEPMEWEPGADHIVALRNPDGTLDGPYIAAQDGDDPYLIVAVGKTSLPALGLSQEPPHALFGTVAVWSFPALITAINPSTETVSATAMNYDARVYADDDNDAP